MNVSLVVAMSRNRVIGKDNDIPWRIPRDWEYLRKLTMNHAIIMGRKNFESIGRPLKGRKNVILTRNTDLYVPDCHVVHTAEEALDVCREEEQIFIFGGEEIYKLFMPYVGKLFITFLHHDFEGDTFFPKLNEAEWKETSFKWGVTDEKNPYSYSFHVYEKK